MMQILSYEVKKSKYSVKELYLYNLMTGQIVEVFNMKNRCVNILTNPTHEQVLSAIHHSGISAVSIKGNISGDDAALIKLMKGSEEFSHWSFCSADDGEVIVRNTGRSIHSLQMEKVMSCEVGDEVALFKNKKMVNFLRGKFKELGIVFTCETVDQHMIITKVSDEFNVDVDLGETVDSVFSPCGTNGSDILIVKPDKPSEFKMHSTLLSDLYNAKPGDKFVLDKDSNELTDIYSEAIENKLWLNVQLHPVNNTYVIDVMSPVLVKNARIIEHLISSGFYGVEDGGRCVVNLPPHININSLKVKFYTLAKGYSLSFFDNIMIVTKSVDKNSVSDIFSDFNTGDIKTISKSDFKNVTSSINMIYKTAKNRGIKVSVKNKSRTLELKHHGLMNIEESQQSFSATFNQWLIKLPVDLPVQIPEKFISVKSIDYIRTLVSTSPFPCRVVNNTIVKRKGGLKKQNGKIIVIVKDKVVGSVNRSSLTSITSRDRKLINLFLKPYELTYEDVR